MTEAGWTREKAEKLCETWFDTGARASWCPKMVDEFAAALADSYQRGWVAGLGEAHSFALDAGAFYTAAKIGSLIDKAKAAQDEKGVGEL